MYKEYEPNELIVDRAVQLWIQMLERPKYDNLGPDSQEPFDSRVHCTMASLMTHALPKNNTPEVLQRFGQELKQILMRDKVLYLSVDYHPDQHLATAAERAGLKMEFPWKTHMHLGTDYVALANGYGATSLYHYPLKPNGWLVASLAGQDIAKIISLVESGVLTPQLTKA